MKKKLALICSTVFLASGFAAFAGCSSETDDRKVMNLSLNPQVEFILNAEDVVVSVNALNEEGNLIASAETFTGKSAGEAAKLFVEVSTETGFLIEGSAYAADNKISVSFSGDAQKAEALYESVQSQITTYLQSVDVTAQLEQAAAITNAQLKALVEECAPYVETAKMKYSELLDVLEESRKETAELYSQELKTAYYEAKAFAMEQAEMEVLKEQLNVVEKLAFETSYKLYSSAVTNLENIRKTTLVDENSLYQKALSALREKKTEFLNYKNYVASLPEGEVSETHTTALAQIATAMDTAEKALEDAGKAAHAQLDAAKTTLTSAYEATKALISDYAGKVKKSVNEISAKQKEAQTAFFSQFESDYAAAKTAAENSWNQMKTALEAGVVNE